MGNDLKNKIMEIVLNELMAGRTFYQGYYEGKNWLDLSRADRAICILQAHLGNHELGYPKGFEEVQEDINRKLSNL